MSQYGEGGLVRLTSFAPIVREHSAALHAASRMSRNVYASLPAAAVPASAAASLPFANQGPRVHSGLDPDPMTNQWDDGEPSVWVRERSRERFSHLPPTAKLPAPLGPGQSLPPRTHDAFGATKAFDGKSSPDMMA